MRKIFALVLQILFTRISQIFANTTSLARSTSTLADVFAAFDLLRSRMHLTCANWNYTKFVNENKIFVIIKFVLVVTDKDKNIDAIKAYEFHLSISFPHWRLWYF